MKAFGIIVFVAAVIGAGLFFGGFVDGDAKVNVTDKGRQTYNQGVGAAQDGLNHLKMDTKQGK